MDKLEPCRGVATSNTTTHNKQGAKMAKSYDKMLVKELRQRLRAAGLDSKGRKFVLIARLEEAGGGSEDGARAGS